MKKIFSLGLLICAILIVQGCADISRYHREIETGLQKDPVGVTVVFPPYSMYGRRVVAMARNNSNKTIINLKIIIYGYYNGVRVADMLAVFNNIPPNETVRDDVFFYRDIQQIKYKWSYY